MLTTLSRRAMLTAVANLTVGSLAIADTSFKRKVKCAVCDCEYEATLTGSSLKLGQRLDLRPVPYYFIVSPERVAVCPKCGFVEFREKEKYPANEVKALREFVLSDDYKKLCTTDTSHYRRAKVLER